MKLTKLRALLACAALSLATAACEQPQAPTPAPGPVITETVDCEANANGGMDLVRRDASGTEVSRRPLAAGESCP